MCGSPTGDSAVERRNASAGAPAEAFVRTVAGATDDRLHRPAPIELADILPPPAP